MDTNPCCCSSAFSKCPPLFPVVKLCLSKLQKPSPAPAQPRCAVPEVIFIPLPAWCHPLPSLPPFPPALPAHTHTHTSVLQSRQSHFLPSAREEQGSVPGVSLSPEQNPQPRPTSPSSPPPAPQGSPSPASPGHNFPAGKRVCHPASDTCSGAEPAPPSPQVPPNTLELQLGRGSSAVDALHGGRVVGFRDNTTLLAIKRRLKRIKTSQHPHP